MKKILVTSMLGLGLAISSSLSTNARATDQFSIVPVPATRVYAPMGFDTNDDTEVVVAGYLPNLCYKSPRTESVVNGNQISINVKAIKTGNSMYCPQMVVPFIESAHLSVLDRGKYEITVNAGLPGEKKADTTIVESTSSAIDDFVYANVQNVEKVPGLRRVTLKGENPTDCYDLDTVKFISNERDTYSVLPILKKVKEVCPQTIVPFSYEVDVPSGLTEKQILLHVRIMNGKSVNMLFTE